MRGTEPTTNGARPAEHSTKYNQRSHLVRAGIFISATAAHLVAEDQESGLQPNGRTARVVRGQAPRMGRASTEGRIASSGAPVVKLGFFDAPDCPSRYCPGRLTPNSRASNKPSNGSSLRAETKADTLRAETALIRAFGSKPHFASRRAARRRRTPRVPPTIQAGRRRRADHPRTSAALEPAGAIPSAVAVSCDGARHNRATHLYELPSRRLRSGARCLNAERACRLHRRRRAHGTRGLSSLNRWPECTPRRGGGRWIKPKMRAFSSGCSLCSARFLVPAFGSRIRHRRCVRVRYVIEHGHRERNGATRRSGSEWSEPKRGAGGNRREAAAPSAKIGRGEWIRTTDPSVPNRR